jgi:ABC-type Fe3+/spermidine/putrescine transport system ATPase subunit
MGDTTAVREAGIGQGAARSPVADDGPAMPRIEVRRLSKTFRRVGGSAVTPVNDITLSVGAREMVVLVGPSGCGKTTLLRCIAGLERPDAGEIIIDGEVVFSSERRLFVPPERRNLSMIFQSYALWPHMSVFENVAYPLESRHVPKREIAPRVSEILHLVGIGDLARQYPGRISGGQQQRVALARALVANARAVLFDEPLSNVDARVREQLRIEMKRMQRQLRFSGLYVTHDQVEAMELGDRIAVLDAGCIAALGPPQAIYDDPPSDYVAGFIGTANIWPGRVLGVDEAGLRIGTDAGEIRARPPVGGDARNLASGAPVSVVVRPEKFRLSATATERPNTIRARVTTRLFSGAHTEFVVQCGDASARVWSMDATAEAPLEGDEAWISVDPAQVRVLPPTATLD